MFIFKLLMLCLTAFATASECPGGSILFEFKPSKCYILVSQKLNWSEAEKFCGKFGGHLGFIEDYDENRFFSAYVDQIFQKNTEFWIGSKNDGSPAVWMHSDGSPLKFANWKNGGPETTNYSRCASVTSENRKWLSKDCSELKAFVCEMERNIQSNEWIPNSETGHQYKVFNFSTTWKNAERICNKESSHLISIHSKQEMNFATRITKPYKLESNFDSCLFGSQTWIGLFTYDDNKTWLWTDDSQYNDTIHKDLWAIDEPDNEGRQDCGNIWTQDPCFPYVQNKFYNHGCTLSMNHFICKKPL